MKQVLLCIAFLGAFALVPLFADDFQLSILALIFLFAYVGQAWNLMMGFAGQLSLGHALYFGVGGYTVAVFAQVLGLTPWLGMAAAFGVCALLGMALGALGFRFAVRGVYFALLTIAFAELARVLFEHWDFVGKTGGLFLSRPHRGEQSPALPARQCDVLLLRPADLACCELGPGGAPGAQPRRLLLARHP